jgi:hypothetical protein
MNQINVSVEPVSYVIDSRMSLYLGERSTPGRTVFRLSMLGRAVR